MYSNIFNTYKIGSLCHNYIKYPLTIVFSSIVFIFLNYLFFILQIYHFNEKVINILFTLFIISVLISLCMFLIIIFSSKITPEEKEKYSMEIMLIKKNLAKLESDDWEHIVLRSLGDKVKHISSKQYYIDVRDSQIRDCRYRLEILEELTKQ